jgi:hypothetical protein
MLIHMIGSVSVCGHVCVCLCLSVCPPFVFLESDLSVIAVSVPIFLCVVLSVSLPVCLRIQCVLCLSVCVSVCLGVSVSVCSDTHVCCGTEALLLHRVFLRKNAFDGP